MERQTRGFAYEVRPTGMLNVLDNTVAKTDHLGLKLFFHSFANQTTHPLNFSFITHKMGINYKVRTWEGCSDLYKLIYVKCLASYLIFGEYSINIYFYYIYF